MYVQKTIQAKIVNPTERKKKFLQKEYDNFQLYLNGIDWDTKLYSATKQQANWKKKYKNFNNEQPMPLRNDIIKIIYKNTKLTKWWFKVPVFNVHGGIYVPIVFSKKQEKLIYECKICDSELVKKDKNFFIHIVIKKEIKIRKNYNDVLAVDMGIRRIATVLQMSNRKPIFYGKELRQIRGHYFYLQRRVQNKKIKHLHKWLKRLSKEQRITNDHLHKISKAIVEQAKQTNSFIVIGDLKHIRKNSKGRKFDRKLNSFSFYKLSNYIKYKANCEGIEVIEVDEAYTSQLCWKCGEKGIRKQGLFKCKHCGLQDNADRNGAINIGKRGIGQALSQGLSLMQPISLAEKIKNECELQSASRQELRGS